MSEATSTPEERTEMPTGRRMGQLRNEGALHMSIDVVQVVTLIAGFYALTFLWSSLITNLKITLYRSYLLIGRTEPFDIREMRQGFAGLVRLIGPDLLLIVCTVALFAVLAVMLQTNWNVKKKKIDFKWNLIDPIGGIKRIFSPSGFINVLKGIGKLALILPLSYFAIKSFAPQMLSLMHMPIEQIFAFTGTSVHTLFWRIMYVLIPFAIFDYFYGKWRWLRTNKMTKQEVKDERKAVEGDEETKRKIVNKGLQRIMQRLALAVPKADVVVTNPTHVAIALKYDRDTMAAPKVLAKGKEHMAKRIRELAREAGVPILERKPLARALYESTEVGNTIPRELFRAVAEVLAYVYRLKNPHWNPLGAQR